MIRVTEFVKNLITGDVSLVYLDNSKERENAPAPDEYKVFHFNSEESAKITLRQIQKKELIADLTKLIVHCEAILSTGHQEYKTKPKLDALDMCLRLKKWLNLQGHDTPLNEICSHVLTVKDCIEKILPHHHNHSYNSSKRTFHLIIEFCQENQKGK